MLQIKKYRSFSHWFSYHWGWFIAGEVAVTIKQYIIDFQPDSDDADTALYYSATLKLMADLELKDCYLFLIEDPESFQSVFGVLQYLRRGGRL